MRWGWRLFTQSDAKTRGAPILSISGSNISPFLRHQRVTCQCLTLQAGTLDRVIFLPCYIRCGITSDTPGISQEGTHAWDPKWYQTDDKRHHSTRIHAQTEFALQSLEGPDWPIYRPLRCWGRQSEPNRLKMCINWQRFMTNNDMLWRIGQNHSLLSQSDDIQPANIVRIVLCIYILIVKLFGNDVTQRYRMPGDAHGVSTFQLLKPYQMMLCQTKPLRSFLCLQSCFDFVNPFFSGTGIVQVFAKNIISWLPAVRFVWCKACNTSQNVFWTLSDSFSASQDN